MKNGKTPNFCFYNSLMTLNVSLFTVKSGHEAHMLYDGWYNIIMVERRNMLLNEQSTH